MSARATLARRLSVVLVAGLTGCAPDTHPIVRGAPTLAFPTAWSGEKLAGYPPPPPPPPPVVVVAPPPPPPPPPAAATAVPAPEPVGVDAALAGQTVLLWRPASLRMDDAARTKVGRWEGDLVDALERRMVTAGLGVVATDSRAHDWDVRVEGAVEPNGAGFVFGRAALRIQLDGVTVDFAEMAASEAVSRRADPEQVAVLLVNALGHSSRLIARVAQRKAAATPAPAAAPPSRPAAPRVSAPVETGCRRQCRAGEALNAMGCCEKN